MASSLGTSTTGSTGVAVCVDLLQTLRSKGPCTFSEMAFKIVKEAHRKMISFCKPLPSGVFESLRGAPHHELIVISEEPRVFGCPPGVRQAELFHNLEVELCGIHDRVVAADRSANARAAGAHAKLIQLMIKTTIILNCQQQQVKLDQGFESVRASFKEIVNVENLEGTKHELPALNKITELKTRHEAATKEGTELAGNSPGGAFVLAPVEGWREAVEAAKEEGYLGQDFPDLEEYPLNKIAAIEFKQVTVLKRQGVRRVPVLEGQTRLLTSPEFEEIKRNLVAGEMTEHRSGEFLLLPTYASGESIVQTSWIDFPGSIRPSNALWQAELVEVEPMGMHAFISSLEDLASGWRYFKSDLARFLQLRKRYMGRPLNVHASFQEIIAFPTAFFQCLSGNLLDQLPREGNMASQARELLESLANVEENEEDFLRQQALEEEEEEDDYYEETQEYFELLADDGRPPPQVNPDHSRPLVPETGRTVMTDEHQENQLSIGNFSRNEGHLQGLVAPEPPPATNSGGGGHRREQALPERLEGRRSRSSSGSDSAQAGGVEHRGAPATTASQIRGDGKTHTIALQLQRSRSVLMTLEANPDSTRYKSQREKVAKMLAEAERHLREDQDVSLSYEDVLEAAMQATEEAMAAKDDEFDLATKEKKKTEEEKKNLLATLPRGLGQKFSGLAQDWPTFRVHFERITKTVDSSLAVAHMIQLVEDPKLKKRMKIYTSGEEILKILDREFGHRFVNCQEILNRVNRIGKATNKKEENNLIVQYRQAKVALEKNKDNENLLNINQLLDWSGKMLPTTAEDLYKIVQESEYGETYSPLEQYFAQLEKVFERNSVLIRHQESLELPKGQSDSRKREKKVEFESSLRKLESEESEGGGCQAFCKTGQAHKPHNCPLLANGKIGLKKVQKAKLCSCCVARPDSCKKGILKRRDGSTFSITCSQCGHSKKIACHDKCKKKEGQPNPSPSISGPPIEATSSAPEAASLTELRCELTVSCLANKNPLGSSSEMVDECVLFSPDGERKLVRVLYDGGSTDTILDFKLARFFHHWAPARVDVNGANSSKKYDSHLGEVRLLKADGKWLPLKAMKGDLAGRAFTLRPKTVDVPPHLHHHFEGTYQSYNDMGDLRVSNLKEETRVDLMIGLDSCALAPYEVARWHDSFGQLTLLRSVISNKLIVIGSRNTGSATIGSRGMDQRTYSILEEGNRPVKLLRATVDLQDTTALFNKRSNLTKIEKKFFSHIEDCDQIIPPLTSQCHTCQGCQVCRDPFKAKREETVIKILDQLVTFKDGKHEEGGGFHIRLLFDPAILANVPEGRSAALRRLLATEKQLMKPGMEAARENFNKKVQACRDKGYLLRPEQLPEVAGMQKAYMPFSFALKDEEKQVEVEVSSEESGAATEGRDPWPGGPVDENAAVQGAHKTKARPVVDCSAVAEPGKASVNQAQFKIPDPHTAKITELLLRLRTAKRFCLGDISEYFFRLWCDPLTSSLTRVLFRDNGLGNDGDIVELISAVSSMGLKQVPSFAAHVRYKLSLLIEKHDQEGAKQLRESYADDIHLAERFGSCRKSGDQGHDCEDGEILVERAARIEKVLNDAHLFLGEKWMTDVEQEKCPSTMIGVAAGEKQVERTLGNCGQTSALGYRLHLGTQQPDGGALLWRVHRPQSLNLEPKSRGARPDWAQLASSSDIRLYLKTHGVTKANLLSLCANLYDPLLLAAPFISSARLLFRQVLREVSLPTWKSIVPERYHERIALLAEDLLEVAKKMKVPRRAVVPNPIRKEEHAHPYGFATLVLISDGSCEAGIAAAYLHQQFPFDSGFRDKSADFSDVMVHCNLLCAALKLTDNQGHSGQVDGELLGKLLSCRLREFVVKNSLIVFHQIRHCSDSLTVERAIRKTDAAYSTWAGKRIAFIQQSMDLDESWHVPHEVTDGTVDCCTKQQKRPSLFLNDGWFCGTGVLNKPLQLLPFTERSTYFQPRLDDLPAQWLSTAARSFIGLKIPAVIVMRVELGEEQEPSMLQRLAEKFSNMETALSVLQYLLRMKKSFRDLPAPRQRAICGDKFAGEDFEQISQELRHKSTRLTRQLILTKNDENSTFTMRGRFGYSARLLANPKNSSFSRLVLRSAHNSHHLTSTARILAKVGRSHVFTGGAPQYLNKLRKECTMCKLLKPQAVQKLLGDTPEFMRGPTRDCTTTWTHQSADIFGPIHCQAFSEARGTRATAKRIKVYGLLVFCYASRAIEAQLCESYSADSIILGFQAIWSRVGRPKFLNCDAAANLASASAFLGGEGEQGTDEPSLAEAERLQGELQVRLGNRIELRPRVPFAAHRQISERGIQFCKRRLRQMLYREGERLLSPLEAQCILSLAVAYVNERCLIIHASPDEQGVLTPWFLTPKSISVFHSQSVDDDEELDHPLSRRAFLAQQRLQLFKGQFDIFHHKELVRFGHWHTEGKKAGPGDVCLILDKEKPKVNFTRKFQLGRIIRLKSDHVCEIQFTKQDANSTAALIKDLKNKDQDWRLRYQVKTSSCTRDVRNLAIIASHQQDQLANGLEVDILVEQDEGANRGDDVLDDRDGGTGERHDGDLEGGDGGAVERDDGVRTDEHVALPDQVERQQLETEENRVDRAISPMALQETGSEAAPGGAPGAAPGGDQHQRKKKLKEKWVFKP